MNRLPSRRSTPLHQVTRWGEDPARNRPGRPGWALAVVGSAQFVLLLDLTIVNVALPTIQHELGIDAGRLQWLVTAYAVTFGGFLLLAGRAADVLGRLRLFVAGIAIFGVASLAAGSAVDESMLILARAGQGLGGAAVSPAALALLTTSFREGVDRNRALGIFAVIASAGAASGLILGGVLTQLAGWRWVFLVNVPVAVAVVALAPIVLRDGRDKVRRPLDLPGAITSTSALLALVLGLSLGSEAGFDDARSSAALAAALVLGFAFVMAERRALDPLVPFHLLRLRALVGADLTSFTAGTVIAAAPFLLTQHMQGSMGLTPLLTGLAFLPMTVTITVTTMLSSRVAQQIGIRRLLLVGGGALSGAALALSRIPPDGRYVADVLPGMLLFAVGLATFSTAATIGATAGVPAADQGVAGGLLNTSRQVGGAVGLAVLGGLASGGLASGGLASGGGAAAERTGKALVEGLSDAFMAALGFAVLTLVVVAALVREPGGARNPSRSVRGLAAGCRPRDTVISPLTVRRPERGAAPAVQLELEAC